MTTKQDLDRVFPSMNQIGGEHYQLKIQPYGFIMENNLSFFQGNVIKYVVRYQKKGGIQDLQKIIHYCELEIERMRGLSDIGDRMREDIERIKKDV